VIIEGNTLGELQEKVKTISKKHVDFLRSKGMVVNPDKTEVIHFEKKYLPWKYVIDNVEVETVKTMKALGLTFKHDLRWDEKLRIQSDLSSLRVWDCSHKNIST